MQNAVGVARLHILCVEALPELQLTREPPLGPLRDDAQTIMITVSGGDLTAYLSGQIGRDEARQRMTVRVF